MRDELIDRLVSTSRMIIGTAELLKKQGLTIGRMENLIGELKEYLEDEGPKYQLLFSDQQALEWMFYKWCRDIKIAETPINVIAFLDENKLIKRNFARRIVSCVRREREHEAHNRTVSDPEK